MYIQPACMWQQQGLNPAGLKQGLHKSMFAVGVSKMNQSKTAPKLILKLILKTLPNTILTPK